MGARGSSPASAACLGWLSRFEGAAELGKRSRAQTAATREKLLGVVTWGLRMGFFGGPVADNHWVRVSEDDAAPGSTQRRPSFSCTAGCSTPARWSDKRIALNKRGCGRRLETVYVTSAVCTARTTGCCPKALVTAPLCGRLIEHAGLVFILQNDQQSGATSKVSLGQIGDFFRPKCPRGA